MLNTLNQKIKKRILLLTIFSCAFPFAVFAETDPVTPVGSWILTILYGPFGISICTLSLVVAILMAFFGKCGWDKFLGVCFLVALYWAAPDIVVLIKNMVHR